jgi:hypothetical protein
MRCKFRIRACDEDSKDLDLVPNYIWKRAIRENYVSDMLSIVEHMSDQRTAAAIMDSVIKASKSFSNLVEEDATWRFNIKNARKAYND